MFTNFKLYRLSEKRSQVIIYVEAMRGEGIESGYPISLSLQKGSVVVTPSSVDRDLFDTYITKRRDVVTGLDKMCGNRINRVWPSLSQEFDLGTSLCFCYLVLSCKPFC